MAIVRVIQTSVCPVYIDDSAYRNSTPEEIERVKADIRAASIALLREWEREHPGQKIEDEEARVDPQTER